MQKHFIDSSEYSDPRVCALVISYMRHLLALRKDEKRNIFNIIFLNNISTKNEQVFRVEDFVTSHILPGTLAKQNNSKLVFFSIFFQGY